MHDDDRFALKTMARSWGPTRLGKLFTGSPSWHLVLNDEQFIFQAETKNLTGSITELGSLKIETGIFWASIHCPSLSINGQCIDGIPNSDAEALHLNITTIIGQIIKGQELLKDFDKIIEPMLSWTKKTIETANDQLHKKGWLSAEFVKRQYANKPKDFDNSLSNPTIVKHLKNQPIEIQDSLKFWSGNLSTYAKEVNERHLAKQLKESKKFFDSVEKSPLTEEQAKAVVCFDNRMLLVASAGSGKTSTMVAKAGYALKNGYFEANRILLLAYNRDAAEELRQRIQDRLNPLGLPADKIIAKTFHAFGLDIIGVSTGKRPNVATWVENNREIEKLLNIVEYLKEHDTIFRKNWDMFRILLSEDMPKFTQEEDIQNNVRNKNNNFWTLNNEYVKSWGEKIIADWLFYNGVKYVYEAPYEVDTANEQHRQYHPDFYLPDAKAYLEHWALDDKGEPPPAFKNYKEGMAWKKQVHAANNTRLLETTMAELWSGKAFEYLEAQLENLGVTLVPNPNRPIPGKKAIENPRLAVTFRTFMKHAKSNQLKIPDLQNGLQSGVVGNFKFRHAIFINLFEKIWNQWEFELKQAKSIDFEDMLNLAADCIEQGKWKSPYDLVMVDEFQDCSQARARLISSLVYGPDKYLFAVGDDWQSINRYAGADLAVMTNFKDRFNDAVYLKLETTFRSPQSLCNISSTFVQKNPAQIRKTVRSSKGDIEKPVQIIRVKDEEQIKEAVEIRLGEIIQETATQKNKPKALLLGRYNTDKKYLPNTNEQISLDFITVHSSKGLEADHIILPKMTAETMGFPSQIADDPILRLAMADGDSFENAEERRLFYVALTRARFTVTLITIAQKESPFIMELARENRITIRNIDGTTFSNETCTKCGKGFMIQRNGKHGPFISCSTYPKCKNKKNIDSRFKTN